jgi:hypothetical protein
MWAVESWMRDGTACKTILVIIAALTLVVLISVWHKNVPGL